MRDDIKKRAWDALSGLIRGLDARGENDLADKMRDIAVLSGHPNFPVPQPLKVWPTDPVQKARYEAHHARMVAEERFS